MKKKKPPIKTNPTGVSTKGYNPAARQSKPPVASAPKRKSLSPKSLKLIISITSIVLVLAIAVGIVAVVLHNRKANQRVDFLNDDLSQYVKLDRDDYYGAMLEISIPEVSEHEVYTDILKTLASKKGDVLNDGNYQYSLPIKAGDKAFIWYRGYELDENGNKIDISGTCNMFDNEATELVIGGGTMVPGFELQLLNMIPNLPDDPGVSDDGLKKYTEGEIGEDDLVFIEATYAVESEDFYEKAKLVIDLSDTSLDEKWGVDKDGKGIKDYILSIGLGNSVDATVDSSKIKEFTNATDEITFIKTSVLFSTRCEVEPKQIKVTFPYDYDTEEFRNREVIFDIYLTRTLHYESAELDDEFITEVLKISSETLDKYEGNSLTDKYINGLWAEKEEERRAEVQIAAEEKFWETMKKRAVFTSLPEAEVQAGFDRYYYMLEMQYIEQFRDSYENVESFIAANFELSSVDQWRPYLRSLVEEEVKEKIIFFYIMRQENLTPTEEQFNSEYREILESEYYNYYGKSREDYGSDEAYDEVIERYEKSVIEEYGYDVYFQAAYYNLRVNDILNLFEIKNEFEWE